MAVCSSSPFNVSSLLDFSSFLFFFYDEIKMKNLKLTWGLVL